MPRRKFAWEKLSDEQLLKQRLSSLRVAVDGTWLEDCLDALQEELDSAGHPVAAAHLAVERMVQPGWRARHRHPVLSHPSPPDEAREEDDARRRGRHLVRVHGHSPSRGRPCHAARLPAASPPALAAAVRPVVETLSALLSAQSGQPELCPASAALVRAEPSGRGFCRDLRGMAPAAFEMADALCRLAGAEEARICRRTDGTKSPASGRLSRRGSASIRCISSARRSASTTRKSRHSTHSSRRRPTTATCPGSFPPIRGIAGRSRPPSSSGGTARKSGSWLRGGPARTS